MNIEFNSNELGLLQPIQNYYNNPAISNSKLKLLKQSPRHFWNAYINPNRQPQVDTPQMALGRAIHHYILEHDSFNVHYAVLPVVNGRTNAGAVILKDFKLEHVGKNFITQDDFIIIQGMRESLLSYKQIATWLERGVAEKEFYYKDNLTGVDCKAKLDYLIEPNFINGLILDIKSTNNASVDEFNKSIYNYGYYRQAPFYIDAINQHYGELCDFIFIAVEKTAPYEFTLLRASDEMVKIGREENNKLLDIYSKCLATDTWNGYNKNIIDVDLPAWAIKQIREAY
jgi:exodeoxyribonuclease VIII